MQYNPPYGASDINAPYIDGNPAAAVLGSIPPAAMMEFPQRELINLITYAESVRPGSVGTPSNSDLEQVLKAILALLANNQDALLALPIYPELTNNNGFLVYATGVGSITVDPSNTIRRRGFLFYPFTAFASADRTLTTAASKTYHLRWHAPGTGEAVPATTYPNGRLRLKDVADASYNTTGWADAANNVSSYDSTEDDVFLARVVTSSGNALTVTPVCNKTRLYYSGKTTGTPVLANSNAEYDYASTITLNWARMPKLVAAVGYVGCPTFDTPGYLEGAASRIDITYRSPYQVSATTLSDWTLNTVPHAPYGAIDYEMWA